MSDPKTVAFHLTRLDIEALLDCYATAQGESFPGFGPDFGPNAERRAAKEKAIEIVAGTLEDTLAISFPGWGD